MRLKGLAALSFASLGLRLLFGWLVTASPAWDGVIYERAAWQLARGEGFTRRIFDAASVAKPTAFYPVGWPAVLAVPRWMGLGASVDVLIQSIACVSLIPLTWLLTRRIFGERAATRAAWIAALWPGGWLLSSSYLAEPLATLGVAIAATLWLYRDKSPRVFIGLACVVLGVTSYVRPTAYAIGMVALVWFVVAARKNGMRTLVRAVVCGCLMFLPLLPWTIRNARVLGEPVLVSTNSGVNLLIGTYGYGGFEWLPKEADCKRGQPEVAFERCRRDKAMARIKAEPVQWMGRGVIKLAHTFGHESALAEYWHKATGTSGALRTWLVVVSSVFWVALVFAACRGVWRTRLALALDQRMALYSPVLGLAVLHFVHIGGDRYHAIVIPMFAALASVGLARVAQGPGTD